MRLALSLLAFRPGRIGGAETYVRRLLAEVPHVVGTGETPVAVMDADLAPRLATPGWDRVVVPQGAGRIVVERILEALTPWRARAAERAFTEAAADVILFPQQSIFPKRVAGKILMTAVDVQHLYHPENIAISERVFRGAIYPQSLARADHVVAISEFTRSTLIERCGIAPNRITAVPLGYDPQEGEVTATGLVERPYFFYPAATFPHKNHTTLFRTYASLRRAGAVDGRLVLTGMQTREWPALERLARELGVGRDVVHLGFLPYDEIRRVFAGAEAVLFPSTYEGFGIPVVEAAVEFGKKVITSRLPVLDEIGVPADRQIDFGDPDALLAALRLPGPTVLRHPPSTWRDCAARTVELARRIAS